MKNKVWLLKRREEFDDWSRNKEHPWAPWYDKMIGIVVVAENEANARSIAARTASDEGPDAWLLEKWSTCVEVDTKTESYVLTDVHEA